MYRKKPSHLKRNGNKAPGHCRLFPVRKTVIPFTKATTDGEKRKTMQRVRVDWVGKKTMNTTVRFSDEGVIKARIHFSSVVMCRECSAGFGSFLRVSL